MAVSALREPKGRRERRNPRRRWRAATTATSQSRLLQDGSLEKSVQQGLMLLSQAGIEGGRDGKARCIQALTEQGEALGETQWGHHCRSRVR